MSEPWWRNAVIYAVDVQAFQDSDGDGVGDLRGLRSRLDHIADLGATCVWLLPFYESPNLDGRYDVADHCAVDPVLGTRADLDALVADIHDRGMRVLIDLVLSHTSTEHRWFQASRRGDPAYRDHYVWRDRPDPTLDVEPMFPGASDSVWSWDELAGAHYLHRFYEFEPDLNTADPRVREEVARIVRFWLEAGIDGFRIDAAPYIAHKAAWADPNEGGRWVLRDLRALVDEVAPDTLLMPEADVDAEQYRDYLAAGMDLQLDFVLNNELFLALARREGAPLVRGLERLRTDGVLPSVANWVRNHDELDLGRLSDAERAEVYEAFAPDPGLRIYQRGIRRRLPPMVGGDRCLIELAYSIVLSLPGVPVLRYGEEIGMGDDMRQPERAAVRSSMQWTSEAGAGFSTAPTDRWACPPVPDGPYDQRHVNVADQAGDPASLLESIRRLVAARRACPEIGTTVPHILEAPPAVLALCYPAGSREVVVVHNLGREEVAFDLPSGAGERLHPAGEVTDRRVVVGAASSAWYRLEH